MPVFLLSLLGNKYVWYLLAALAAAAALFGVYKHIELVGEHKALAAVKAASDKEHDRRMKDLETLQAQFASTVDALHQSEKANADALGRSRNLSRANDSRACLDSASVERLRQIGSGRQGGGGVVKPTGKAAR